MKCFTIRIAFFISILFTFSCNTTPNEEKPSVVKKGTFEYDLHFLQGRDSVIILKSDNPLAQVIVSPKYQGKVFTSTAEGLAGRSFGWINYPAFDEPVNDHMNAYGGEDRLWLGPEGGPFSLFFEKGKEMVFDNWHTPPAFDTDSWDLVLSAPKKAVLEKKMQAKNYAGTDMEIHIKREIVILEKNEIQNEFSIKLPPNVNSVGFSTVNSITNAGKNQWDEISGAPCLWNLDMFTPSSGSVIVIPYDENGTGKIATTDYFGEIPKDRIIYKNGILLFKADGKSRGKLGIPPSRAKRIAGSFDPENNVLTATVFDVHSDRKYLNQEWTTKKDPFSGDAVNAYNDGPLTEGTQMGPFYEIESVSPAAFLKPGESLDHHHSVFHFTGDLDALNVIAKKIFGISLQEIQIRSK